MTNQSINVRQLLETLHKATIQDPQILDMELYIEACDQPNFEIPTSGWKSFRDGEGSLLVQPAWEYGVLFGIRNNRFSLYINY